MDDFRQYYYLESYLFETVGPRFREQDFLSAFDLFCIAIWKANRAKSNFAKRIMSQDSGKGLDLDERVKQLTKSLSEQPTAKDKMRYLIKSCGFRLPTASAILTVLYPEVFTVYDFRVCAALEEPYNLQNRTKFDSLWKGYSEYKAKVERSAPEGLSLRDKDRYLWGKSFYTDLKKDIERKFKSQTESQTLAESGQ